MKSKHFLFLTLLILPFTVFAQAIDEDSNYALVEDILYREAGDLTEYMKQRCLLDFYYPKDRKDFSTIVWFHGGGLKAGNKFIPQTLKDNGIAIVAVNYRFSPEVSSPAYVEDAAAAVAWTFKNIAKYGGDPSRIFVSGHSAGGYLSSMVGLDKSYLDLHGIDANRIAALIPFSGHTITHFTVRSERGIDGTQVVVDEMAPIHHIRKDAPPLVLITGDRELEMLGRYEENAYMYRMMKVIGHEQTTLHELDGFNHGRMAEPAFYILLDYVKGFPK